MGIPEIPDPEKYGLTGDLLKAYRLGVLDYLFVLVNEYGVADDGSIAYADQLKAEREELHRYFSNEESSWREAEESGLADLKLLSEDAFEGDDEAGIEEP